MTHFSCFSFSLQESSQFQELAKERNFYIKLCKTLIKHLVWFMHTSSPLFSDRCIYCIWTVEPRITILMNFFTKDSFYTRHCKATTFTHMVSSHHRHSLNASDDGQLHTLEHCATVYNESVTLQMAANTRQHRAKFGVHNTAVILVNDNIHKNFYSPNQMSCTALRLEQLKLSTWVNETWAFHFLG